MAAKLERTKTPGVFRRHHTDCSRRERCDCPYVIAWRHHGRQYTETFRTYAEAREAKRTRETDLARGEYSAFGRVTLQEYAREWIERYQGNGRRGFREETRDEYRRLLERYAFQYFQPRLRLAELTPRMVAEFIGWLVRQPCRRGAMRLERELGRKPRDAELAQRLGTLSDSAVHNAFKPVAACLATARREGLIRSNPASEATLPHRPRIEEDEDRPRPFPAIAGEDGNRGVETMELVVELVPAPHRPMFALLASTGLNRSELLALEGRHLHLHGERPYVSVRQRVRRQRGKGLLVGPLKSRHRRRDLPIPVAVADQLAALRRGPQELVFQSEAGTLLDPDNLHDRVLRPACEEAEVGWAGFHTFRHTVASRLFARGGNVVQVQRWLGHHSASFTLDTYVHLLDADLGEPLDAVRVNGGSTRRPKRAAFGEFPKVLEPVH
jgi:integrase